MAYYSITSNEEDPVDESWLDEGFSPEEAQEYISEGFDLRESVILRDHRITPVEARGLVDDWEWLGRPEADDVPEA
jgi:hypothetical protein